jgi:hypothetical protein
MFHSRRLRKYIPLWGTGLYASQPTQPILPQHNPHRIDIDNAEERME